MKKLLSCLIILGSILILVSCNKEEVVNVYTTRHYDADDLLYDKFTEQTGIKVNVITDKALVSINKIKEQGDAPAADIYMTANAGSLAIAKSENILQPIESTILGSNIPAKYKDEDNNWFGLTKRARVYIYDTDTYTMDEAKIQLPTYEELADSAWDGKVVARSMTNQYNQDLVSSMIEILGESAAVTWVDGLSDNFARNAEGNDRSQAKYIYDTAGVDIAIANSYYYGKLEADANNADSEYHNVANGTNIFFPNQGDDESGVHINISGAGVIKNAANKENAIQLLEFLSEEEQQTTFSSTNYEFPVNEDATISSQLQGWLDAQGITTLKEQDINLSIYGTKNSKAVEIMTTSKWDTQGE